MRHGTISVVTILTMTLLSFNVTPMSLYAAPALISPSTFEECFTSNYKEPYSDAAFDSQTHRIMWGLQPLEPDEFRTYTLDVTSGSPWQALHTLLGLPSSSTDIPLEDIAKGEKRGGSVQGRVRGLCVE